MLRLSISVRQWQGIPESLDLPLDGALALYKLTAVQVLQPPLPMGAVLDE
jgi:hypothetical protein